MRVFIFFLSQFSDIEKLASFSPKIAKLVKYTLENKNFQKISFFPFLGAKTQKLKNKLKKRTLLTRGVCVHI
jgi:hypothetical protein